MKTADPTVKEEAPLTQEEAPPSEPPLPTPPAPPATPQEPPEDYKAIQRTLSKLQEDNKALAAQVNVLSQQPATTSDAQAQNTYSQYYLAAKEKGWEEEAARAVGQSAMYQVMAAAKSQEVIDLQQKIKDEERRTAVTEASREAVSDMRVLAQSMGLSPDDPNLDYGDEGDEIGTRMRAFRRSIPQAQQAKAAAAPAEPQPAPDRSAEKVTEAGNTAPVAGSTEAAEAAKKKFLDAAEANRAGRGVKPAELARLRNEALAAGATFE